jgi:hypothetical protein
MSITGGGRSSSLSVFAANSLAAAAASPVVSSSGGRGDVGRFLTGFAVVMGAGTSVFVFAVDASFDFLEYSFIIQPLWLLPLVRLFERCLPTVENAFAVIKCCEKIPNNAAAIQQEHTTSTNLGLIVFVDEMGICLFIVVLMMISI